MPSETRTVKSAPPRPVNPWVLRNVKDCGPNYRLLYKVCDPLESDAIVLQSRVPSAKSVHRSPSARKYPGQIQKSERAQDLEKEIVKKLSLDFAGITPAKAQILQNILTRDLRVERRSPSATQPHSADSKEEPGSGSESDDSSFTSFPSLPSLSSDDGAEYRLKVHLRQLEAEQIRSVTRRHSTRESVRPRASMSVPQPPAGAMAAQAVTIGHEQKQPPASTPKLLATKYSGLARGFKPRPVTAPTTLKERAIAASCSHDTQVDSDAALKLSEVIQSLEWWVDHRLCPGFESWTESHLPTELEQAHVAQGHIELRTPPPAQNLDQSVCRGEFDCLMSSWRPVVESNSSKATVKVEARPPKVLLDKVKKAERRTSKPPSTRIGDLSGGNGEEVSAKHAMSDKDRRAAYGPWYIVPSKWKAVLDKRTNPEIKHAGIYAVHPDVPRSSFVVEKLKQMIEDRAKADQLALQDVVVQSPPRSISAFSRTEPVTSSRSMSIFSHADSLPPASSMAQLSPRRQASVSSANSSRRSLHRLSIDYSPMRTFSISTPLQLPGLDE